MPSTLDFLRRNTIVVADTGDFESRYKIVPFVRSRHTKISSNGCHDKSVSYTRGFKNAEVFENH